MKGIPRGVQIFFHRLITALGGTGDGRAADSAKTLGVEERILRTAGRPDAGLAKPRAVPNRRRLVGASSQHPAEFARLAAKRQSAAMRTFASQWWPAF
jgi:hypothetical protein